MTDKDFRYEKDGTEIQAFQMTDRARYAEKEWPVWMDSRWLMTIDGEQWIDYGGKEIKIPPLGWICSNPDGTITARGALEMEAWAKVVPDPVAVVHPESGAGITDAALAAAHGLELKPDNSNIAEVVDQRVHMELVKSSVPLAVDGDGSLLTEVVLAYGLMKDGHVDAGMDALATSCSRRVEWCNCVPGQCANAALMGCRQKSPLL